MASTFNILLFVSFLFAAAAFSTGLSRQMAGGLDDMYPQGKADAPGSKYIIQLDENTYIIDGHVAQKGPALSIDAPSPAPAPEADKYLINGQEAETGPGQYRP